MTDMGQRVAAKQFTKDWAGRGDEKQETQQFWMALLQKVYGVAEPEKAIEFEVPVKLSHTGFIDGYIKDSVTAFTGNKLIYTADRPMVASNINSYLLDAPIVFVESRTKPLDYVPQMSSGGKPVEGGHLIFSKDEKEAFLQNEPGAEKFFKRFVGSDDFINGYERWCLWLYNANPKELHGLPAVMKKVEAVRDYRLASSKAATRACAEYPTQFMEIKLPKGQFLIVPEVSSEKRKYIPIGYAQDMICSNLVRYVPDATLFHFGVLTSNVHMAWMRAVCGRLEMRYRYSANVVYNNFPWPKPTDTQKAAYAARKLQPDR